MQAEPDINLVYTAIPLIECKRGRNVKGDVAQFFVNLPKLESIPGKKLCYVPFYFF